MISEKDLLNQNTFYKYGGAEIEHGHNTYYWYQGSFDCGLQIYENGISFFLHDEVYGKKWHIRNIESLEDLEYLYNAIYPKDKFRMEKNDNYNLIKNKIRCI